MKKFNGYVPQMTWEEYRDRAGKSFIILPAGSTEQHAPHLPLGVDQYISFHLSREISLLTGSVVAPVLPFGYKSQPASGGGPLFPGTLDLSGSTYINLVKDLLEEIIADGFTKILIYNGHFENISFLSEAADLVTRKITDYKKSDLPALTGSSNKKQVKIILTSWWDHLNSGILSSVFDIVPFPGWELEHAAIAETSLMLYFEPEMVKLDRVVEAGLETLPPYQVFPADPAWVHRSGTLHTARTSSSEKGKILSDAATEGVMKVLRKEGFI